MHCVADLLFAVPLFVAPGPVLTLLGWPAVDPIATRLVAAALLGIGLQSWIGRDEPIEVFRGMLNLKVIWSGAASLGILWSQLQGGPAFGWAFLGIFLGFNGVWSYYRRRLGSPSPGVTAAPV